MRFLEPAPHMALAKYYKDKGDYYQLDPGVAVRDTARDRDAAAPAKGA